MAALQERNGSFRVLFRHHGKQYSFPIGGVPRAEAEVTLGGVEETLLRLRQGFLKLPPGGDVVAFVRHKGDPPAPAPTPAPGVAAAPPRLTLGRLRDRYLEAHGPGVLEAHTLAGIRRHFGHLARHFGEGLPVADCTAESLQGYVAKRAQAPGRRGTLDPATIRKEVVTFRTAWNWAAKVGLVAGRLPADALRYPKGDEKPPFRSRAEIARQLRGATDAEAAALWECLYLTLDEVRALLAHARAAAAHPWIHPMLATAALTGARRGELLRMRAGDVDLAGRSLVVRERKRAHGKRTTRRVPLPAELAVILRDWLAIHPGGPLLFAQGEVVGRSKKRSATTGHRSADRPTTGAGRRATVSGRTPPGVLPITEGEAHDHLKRTLRGSEWAVIRGWHVFRHSFVSACASKGVDLRMLQEWCGHMSADMQRRYMHLYPDVQAEAIDGVFGGPESAPT